VNCSICWVNKATMRVVHEQWERTLCAECAQEILRALRVRGWAVRAVNEGMEG
jgi:protein-arginine kinase activator protein McsA